LSVEEPRNPLYVVGCPLAETRGTPWRHGGYFIGEVDG
jgi:hypothetical protein